jgi:hypothetical protein
VVIQINHKQKLCRFMLVSAPVSSSKPGEKKNATYNAVAHREP